MVYLSFDQCNECIGTNYYFQEDRWSFLDAVMLKKNRNSKFIENSVVVINQIFILEITVVL